MIAQAQTIPAAATSSWITLFKAGGAAALLMAVFLLLAIKLFRLGHDTTHTQE